jgi:hypothetical protein
MSIKVLTLKETRHLEQLVVRVLDVLLPAQPARPEVMGMFEEVLFLAPLYCATDQ